MSTAHMDEERVQRALDFGATAVSVHCTDAMTRRAHQPDVIAHGPDGDVLQLARRGKVTALGKEWDKQCKARAGF